MGRPSIDPVVFFKSQLIAFFEIPPIIDFFNRLDNYAALCKTRRGE